MFDLINRGALPDAVADEFQHLISQIRGVFLKEHNEDGTHFIRPSGFDFVPIGAMVDWPTNTAPTGWALCDGSQLSRAKYASLFAVIGTTYGVGDGSTTFNVPDCRGRFSLGKAAAGTGSTLAGTGGALDHTHSVSTDPGHTHTASSGSAGAHDHGGATGSESSHTHAAGAITSTVTTDFVSAAQYVTSGGQPFHVASTGSTTGAGSSHSHSISSDGTHSHTVTVDAGGSHTHTLGTANPPYLVVNRIILTGVA